MPLPIGEVIGILADNLRLRKSVMPLTKRRATRWARGLGIPAGGDTVLYTGHMYQLMPSIASLEAMMARMENSWITRTMHLGRLVNQWFNTSRFMAFPSRAAQDEFDQLLRNIATVLKQAGVEFGYLYDKELYAGALVCDHGVDHVFKEHARKVYEVFKRHGVKRAITVDPHTTDMLRAVYPTIIDGYDLEVQSYLEVLAERLPEAARKIEQEVVLHDSCVYARYEGVIDQPRSLLQKAGLTLCEQDDSGKLTQCCGGPIESLYPTKAKDIAAARLGQLRNSGAKNVVTMCPICLLNLRRAAAGNGLAVSDISEYLARAFGSETPVPGN